MDRPLRLQNNESPNSGLHLSPRKAKASDEQGAVHAQTIKNTARPTRFAKTQRYQQEKRVRLTGATPIMVMILLYCFYLSILYTQPIVGEVDVLPYRVHLQTDPVEVLELLPGIGPTMAKKIADFREEHSIESPDDLIKIHGIGEKTVDQLRRLTTSKPNHVED